MKLRFHLFLYLLLLTTRVFAQPQVTDGVLDLRGQGLTDTIELRGDWSFYWQKHVFPHEFASHDGERVLLKVPGNWYQDKRHDFSVFGYGTYHLRIQLDHPMPLALSLSEIWAASRIFVNGKELAVYGQPGRSAATHQGRTGMSYLIFTPDSPTLDILVQVSNFDIFLSGITKIPSLGPIKTMQLHRDRQIAIDVLVVGALLIMSIYHLCLFALRTEDKSTLCFAIVCFFVAAYTSTVGTEIFITLWPETSYDMRLRILNFSWMVATHAFIWFSWILFQPHYKKKVLIVGSWIAWAHHLMCLTTGPRIFVNMSLLFEFVVVPILAHAFWAAWKSRHTRKESSGIFLTGTVVLVLVVINDILSVQRRIPLPPLGGFGVLAFILVQSYLLAHRFSMAFIRLRHKEREVRQLSENLKEVNENLEQTVEDKTRDIRSIMQHIPLGIFMLSGPDGVIARDYSQHLKQIFLHDRLEGLVAARLLLEPSQLTADEKSQALSAIQASLNEVEINFDINRDALPLHIEWTRPDGMLHLYDLTWDKIVNDQGITEKILVTIRDVTELKGLQRKALDHKEELEMIGEILNVTPARFHRFMQGAMDLIEENERLLQQVEAGIRDADLFKIIFINLHTLKGSARSLYFKGLTGLLHGMEQYYAGLKDPKTADALRMREDQKLLSGMIQRYDRIARDKLGRTPTDRMRVDLTMDDVAAHLDALMVLLQSESIPKETRREVQDMSTKFIKQIHTPLREIIGEIGSVLPALARDLQKERPELDVVDDNLLASALTEDLLHRVFVHLLRNSMDHGIEAPEERRRKQKSRQPRLFIHCETRKDKVLIRYWDDGRGLNLHRLSEVALEHQLLSKDEAQNPQQFADLLLTSHLSTAQSVTDISGRGVGMGAIRQYVEQAGGQVRIRLQGLANAGFIPFLIEMELPSRLFMRSDFDRPLSDAS
ncbi:MAG TPA: 7TM diverse intracellular signaling domain-containing protein [Oligoflexus sp.]|uniref:7TM diverse intracellular signaling domain-containing protein n=1 Tax=Oligoflexus sp. TaxID=1971216 RepID=UPI002D809361|nr:7TM diverse intracellular signaling domain-containing protein [Oligoflexus sp.]HET9235712.1 7TM diverse intracellular signaling domain-containing protein [Oligoflexus sp.]